MSVSQHFDNVYSRICVDIRNSRIRSKNKIAPLKIIFVTSRGTMNCNPRFIAEEILKQHLPWDLVWVCRKENMRNSENYPKNLRLVKRDSIKFHEEISSAHILIDNSINLVYMGFKKKKGQILIETWHGSLGLKRFETSNDKTWIKNAQISGNYTDYFITNSVFEQDICKNSFWKNSEFLMLGHARNDILFDTKTETC